MAQERYPLSWPTAWKRTHAASRQRADFSKTITETRRTADGAEQKVRRTGRIDVSTAVQRLEDQLDRLGATGALLSTNVELRIDGRPRAGRVDPYDPGAAVYFMLNGKPLVLACDRWDRVADNVAALANHIDALRRIERYGVGRLEQAFAGYAVIGHAAGVDWWLELGVSEQATTEQIEMAYREKARAAHPDAGGSHEAMARLNAARDAARKARTK